MTISDTQSVNEGTADRPPQSLPNGKPDSDPAADHASYDEVQLAITRIWEAVLRLDGLSAEDDFFELGGHSLAASQVISRMRESLQVEVGLAAFFECSTIGELAALVVRLRDRADTDGPGGPGGPGVEKGGR